MKPKGAELEQTDFILGRLCVQKHKIKTIWLREHTEGQSSLRNQDSRTGANRFYFGPLGA